jgi:hypothetical protein
MSAAPLCLTVYDDASGYVEDLQTPALPVFNAVEVLEVEVRG